MSQAVSIRKIDQVNNFVFAVQWNDGKISEYRLSELQKRCPCASCVDEITGERRPGAILKENVRAITLSSVGRYALRIRFTEGCSNGIYSYDMLRNMNEGRQ
jgi:DUF971 family protein